MLDMEKFVMEVCAESPQRAMELINLRYGSGVSSNESTGLRLGVCTLRLGQNMENKVLQADNFIREELSKENQTLRRLDFVDLGFSHYQTEKVVNIKIGDGVNYIPKYAVMEWSSGKDVKTFAYKGDAIDHAIRLSEKTDGAYGVRKDYNVVGNTELLNRIEKKIEMFSEKPKVPSRSGITLKEMHMYKFYGWVDEGIFSLAGGKI